MLIRGGDASFDEKAELSRTVIYPMASPQGSADALTTELGSLRQPSRNGFCHLCAIAAAGLHLQGPGPVCSVLKQGPLPRPGKFCQFWSIL